MEERGVNKSPKSPGVDWGETCLHSGRLTSSSLLAASSRLSSGPELSQWQNGWNQSMNSGRCLLSLSRTCSCHIVTKACISSCPWGSKNVEHNGKWLLSSWSFGSGACSLPLPDLGRGESLWNPPLPLLPTFPQRTQFAPHGASVCCVTVLPYRSCYRHVLSVTARFSLEWVCNLSQQQLQSTMLLRALYILTHLTGTVFFCFLWISFLFCSYRTQKHREVNNLSKVTQLYVVRTEFELR